MAEKKDYLGLDRLVSVILAIIPITSWILGIVVRAQEKKYVAAILRVFLGWLTWIPDIILMVLDTRILRLLDM